MSTGANGDRPFVHLHVHSHFSLRDGVAPVDGLVRQAAAFEMNALALTDHNSLAGMITFIEACEAHGLQPISGCQLDVAPWPDPARADEIGSLVLLVESENGYRNLTQLVTRAHARAREGRPPHVTHRELAERCSGLIALIGASSPIRHYLNPPEAAKIEAYLTDVVRIFGKQNLYFEIVTPATEEIRSLNEYFMQLSEFLGIGVVATNDVHYILPEDELARLFRAGQTAPSGVGEKGLELGRVRRHLCSSREMRDWFAFVPQALTQSQAIAERCRFAPRLRQRRLLVHDFARGLDAESHLWDLVFRHATQRYGELGETIKSRLNEEFDYLARNGLPNFFLLLWKLANFLTEQQIPCLVRHGPITASLIAFVLGLTGLDPLAHRLPFEPLIEGGSVFPDVAVQVTSRHRPRVLQYLEQSYGAERIARVGRHQYWTKPQLLDALCRWAGLPEDKAQALQAAEAIATGRGEPPRWSDLFRSGVHSLPPQHTPVLSFLFSRLHPLPRGLEAQASRLVLSREPVDEIVPIAWPDGQTPTTELDASDCDALGLPRLDVNASVALDVLDEAVGWVRREKDRRFNVAEVPLDDAETFRFLTQGRTAGVPGFEGVVARSLLRREKPTRLEDLIQVRMKSQGGKSGEVDDAARGSLLADCQMAYVCAYLKAKYPGSYYTALLTHVCRRRRRLARVLREMQQEGIRLLPPDINMSSHNYTQIGERIRTGLIVVRQLGEKAAEEIASIRRGGEFQSLLDFCRRTDRKLIPHRLIENLVKAGAMDGFGLRRSQLLALLDQTVGHSRATAKARVGPQMELELPDVVEGDPGEEIEPPDLPELPPHLRLQYELQAAGYAISGDLLESYAELLARCRISRAPVTLSPRLEGRDLYLGGTVLQMERAAAAELDDPGAWLDFDGVFIAVPERLFTRRLRELRGTEPLLIGGTVVRRDEECFMQAHTILTLIKVHQQVSQAQRLVLDLENEGRHTVRALRQLCAQFPGSTPVEGVHLESVARRFWPRKLEFSPVTVCPPLINALRKVLSDERVTVVGFGQEE